MYGLCNLSVIPCRLEASDASEQVTQLLFGDHFEVLSHGPVWCRIRLATDGYEGFIGSKQFRFISPHTFSLIENTPMAFFDDLVQVVYHENSQTHIPLVLGSNLPLFAGDGFEIENDVYRFQGKLFTPLSDQRRSLQELAGIYLNAPYQWGGKSPFGIDCSGFVQLIFKMHGILLPRDARVQAEYGNTLSFVEESEPGDLAFFDNEEGNIIHVGMVIAGGKIIHASGKVRIDKLDHQGIYNVEARNYTHRLRLLKRIVDEVDAR
ncbi:MAG: NlpC/P60 family protein [Bacteroidota bacterium]